MALDERTRTSKMHHDTISTHQSKCIKIHPQPTAAESPSDQEAQTTSDCKDWQDQHARATHVTTGLGAGGGGGQARRLTGGRHTSLGGQDLDGVGHGPLADGRVGQHADGVGAVGIQSADGGQTVVVGHLQLFPHEDGLLGLQRVEHLIALAWQQVTWSVFDFDKKM